MKECVAAIIHIRAGLTEHCFFVLDPAAYDAPAVDGIPCGHAVTAIQRLRPPAPPPPPPHSKALESGYVYVLLQLVATYSQALTACRCGAGISWGRCSVGSIRRCCSRKAKGRPQITAQLTAVEQRVRRAARIGALPKVPLPIWIMDSGAAEVYLCS